TLAAMRRRAEARREALYADPMQPAIFEQMRSMIDPSRTPDPVLREEIFERLALVTAGPADEVLYLLSLGAFMVETDRPGQAVGAYQTVLKTPARASQPYAGGFVPQPAGQEARHRMEQVMLEAPFAYAKFDAEASQRLAELIAAPRPSVDALIDLARQYPL